jgi:hypothetical protein
VRPLALLLALLAITPALACGGSDEDSARPSPAVSSDRPGHDRAGDREPAPAIVGVDLAGEAISLRDFRGRPVLVNVWSSW